eukprot:TRINITY_DN1109_c0_g1_i9.p2 TRINITY_DN1109_c0_g1~~TRINITY_DN1109_c0_g1_i9.p2  ORF type:complete len:189 (+),score=19.13 TRINITY_DN1109_c0_g1_i9:58-567(+)
MNSVNKYLPILLVLAEIFLNFFIIENVPYTEIDWKAYMSEVEGVHNGTFDYIQLKGDTGPLVYPGGFVLVFYLLYWLTDQGKNIYLAQFLFLFLYVAVQALVFAIYKHSQKIPVWVIVLLCLSKRIHSIFILRLFNDTFAMFFLYLAIYFFLKDRWSLGCFSYRSVCNS